jgi:hypothetical protein
MASKAIDGETWVRADDDETAWSALDHELSLWQAAGRRATFWWRDDDAAANTDPLARMIRLSNATGIPVALAVVPAKLQSSLSETLRPDDPVTILQHGWNHINHASGTGTRGAWELGLHRGLQSVLTDLEKGREVLGAAFADRFLPIIAPPWNNIDPMLLPHLAKARYRAVSTFGARQRSGISAFISNNCHCDPINWKANAEFRGVARALATLISHLSDRRTVAVDQNEATGLLTHHLDMDEAAWRFTERLLRELAAHPAVQVLGARQVFAP